MAGEIKIATFNVEWMVNLFRNGQAVLAKRQNKNAPGLGSKPRDPQAVAERIAAVIRDVGADIIGICEGPPLKSQMETFVKQKLDNQYTVYSMEDGVQSVHALVRKGLDQGLTLKQLPPSDKVFERLRTTRSYYKFGNVRTPHNARFTRLPVVLRLSYNGSVTEIMALHTKSKISQLRHPSDWKRRTPAKVVDAINSRQKLSIEMNVIRKYIAHRLYSRKAESVIVMGDMNDGVSRDLIDDTYLLHSIVHELRGAFQHEIALMRHVLTPRQLQNEAYAWTVEFKDATNGGRPARVLLDHMLYSPRCHEGGSVCMVRNSGQIEHKAYDRHVDNRGRTRDDRPSDHRPLSARFTLA